MGQLTEGKKGGKWSGVTADFYLVPPGDPAFQVVPTTAFAPRPQSLALSRGAGEG